MRHAVSFRTYLTVMNVGLLLLAFISIGTYVLSVDSDFSNTIQHHTVKQMRQNLESQSATLVRSISLSAAQAIVDNNHSILNDLLRQVVSDNEQILYAVLMASPRKAVSHSDPALIGIQLEEDIDYYSQELLDKIVEPSPGSTKRQVYFIDEFTPSPLSPEPVMEALTPVGAQGRIIGLLRCGFSLKNFHAALASAEKDWAER